MKVSRYVEISRYAWDIQDTEEMKASGAEAMPGNEMSGAEAVPGNKMRGAEAVPGIKMSGAEAIPGNKMRSRGGFRQ